MKRRKTLSSVLIVIFSATILLAASPTLSFEPADSEQKWFESGVKDFHDLQYGFGRIWTNQLYDTGTIISVNPQDMDDYTALEITPYGIYSIAIDEVHNCVWAVLDNLFKVSADNSYYERYPFPPPLTYDEETDTGGGGLQVTWDGKYVWIGTSGYPAYVLRFYPETEEWIVIEPERVNGRSISFCRDVVYDPVRNCIWAFSFHTVTKINRETAAIIGTWDVAIPVGSGEIFSAVFNGEYLFAGGPDDPDPAYVVRIDPNNPDDQVAWKLEDYFGFGALYWPHTLIADADGIVYAGLYKSSYVIFIDPETGPYDYIGIGAWFCHGLAFDDYGWLWLSFNHEPGILKRYYLAAEAPPPPPPPEEAVVTGYVTYENGDPIENALVEVGDYSTYTDENGFYSVTVPIGTYDVQISVLRDFSDDETYQVDFTVSSP